MKIYTRTGDSGQTQLLGGGRVDKDDARVAAYGDVDELNSAIGVAIAAPPTEQDAALLEAIQRDLFAIGGQLASPNPDRVATALAKAAVPTERIAEFEQFMDQADAELPALRAFVLPGGTSKAAHFHLARTVCRRAERSVVSLARDSGVPGDIVRYLNRLSDLLFTMARLANHRAGCSDRIW